ncbi:MAG: hypothetical protein INQ03_23985 [Candidatus Heimdallarchaeota archaeon]|nr:hypothetical protein [Candidatus Heimdallarchaeota archaeon]
MRLITAFSICLVFLLLPVSSHYHDGWSWNEAEIVSNGANATYVKAASDSQGNIHIIWVEYSSSYDGNSDRDIIYRMWNRSSMAWEPESLVSSTSNTDTEDPEMCIDGKDVIHLVWTDATDWAGAGIDKDIWYTIKKPGGPWGFDGVYVANIASIDSTVDSTLPDIACGYDTSYIVWQEGNFLSSGSDQDIFYRELNGTTYLYSDYELVSDGLAGSSQYPVVAYHDGQVYVAWSDASDYHDSGTESDIFFRSRDASGNWGDIVVAFNTAGGTYEKDLYASEQGTIHLAWTDTDPMGPDPDLDLFYRNYDVNTLSWSEVELISTEGSGHAFGPSIAADARDNVYLAWYDTDTLFSAATQNVILRSKMEGVWSGYQVLTEGSTQELYPNVIVDANQFVHIFNYRDSLDTIHRVFGGPPLVFNLNIPVMDDDGTVYLSWSESYAAEIYQVYRSTEPIYSTLGLEPISISEELHYSDLLETEGVYFYAIEASNYKGKRLSNLHAINYEDTITVTQTVDGSITTTEINQEVHTSTMIETSLITETFQKTEAPMAFVPGMLSIILIPIFLKRKK